VGGLQNQEKKRIEKKKKRKEKKNNNRTVICKPESKELLGRTSSRWEHTIIMDLKGTVSENVISIHLAQNIFMCRLTTGICSEKCVVRRFRRCENVIERTYTNLDITVYYTPSLLLLGYNPVQHVTVLNTVSICNTMVL
jgi:hypothetical protein